MTTEHWRVVFYHRRTRARAVVDVDVPPPRPIPDLIDMNLLGFVVGHARRALEERHPTAAEPAERMHVVVLSVERLTLDGQPIDLVPA